MVQCPPHTKRSVSVIPAENRPHAHQHISPEDHSAEFSFLCCRWVPGGHMNNRTFNYEGEIGPLPHPQRPPWGVFEPDYSIAITPPIRTGPQCRRAAPAPRPTGGVRHPRYAQRHPGRTPPRPLQPVAVTHAAVGCMGGLGNGGCLGFWWGVQAPLPSGYIRRATWQYNVSPCGPELRPAHPWDLVNTIHNPATRSVVRRAAASARRPYQ